MRAPPPAGSRARRRSAKLSPKSSRLASRPSWAAAARSASSQRGSAGPPPSISSSTDASLTPLSSPAWNRENSRMAASAAAVGGVSKGAQQERHVKVLGWILDFEAHHHFGVEGAGAAGAEIRACVEPQAIRAGAQGVAGSQEVAQAAVGV